MATYNTLVFHTAAERRRAHEAAERARAWITSEAGQQQLLDSMEQAAKLTEELREARKIDPAILREPMTI